MNKGEGAISDPPSIAVVGAGFGGLAAAHHLQAAGAAVTLYDRRPVVGGKARSVDVSGVPVPAGPSVLTMRHVFDRLFGATGRPLDAHIALSPLKVLAHHRWSADERLDLFHDIDESAEAITAFAGPGEADGYRRFVADAADVFRAVEKPFIHAEKPDLFGVAMSVGPLGAFRIKPFDTLWSAIGKHFSDPRLHQLFGRYATYCGASPYLATATLMLVAHVEQAGVWTVPGGMAALAATIAADFEAHGGRVETGAHVDEILVKNGRAAGVVTARGAVPADAVVFAGDAGALGEGLLGRAVRPAAPAMATKERSLSAMTFCGTLIGPSPLGHHTVAFGPDYANEFRTFFERGDMPDRPTVYLCAPEAESFDGGQPVLVVMNAPANGDRHTWSEEDIARCKTQAMDTLGRAGLATDLTNLHPTTPSDLSKMLPGTGGAIYGRVPHGWTASFQRPAVRSRVKGLTLAGGSVHPGPGVPMSALSGLMAAASVMKAFGLTHPSRPAATSGGMSMASATMAKTP